MLSILVASVVLPIIGALLIVLMSRWLRRGSGTWRDHVGWEGALLLALIAASHLALVGWHGFPPLDVKFWPIFIAFAAIPLAAVHGPAQGGSWWLWAVRLALSLLIIVGASILLLQPEIRSQGRAENAELLAVVIIGWLATTASWSFAAKASTPGALLTAMVVTTALSAYGILLYGAFTYAQVIGILGFSLGVITVMYWLGAMSRIGAVSVAIAASIILPMWWILGVTMADLPRWAPPLFLLAGASSAVTALPIIARQSAWKRLVCVAVVASAFAAPVIISGVIASLHQMESRRQSGSSDADGN